MSSTSSLILTFWSDVSFLGSALVLCCDFSTRRFDERRFDVETFDFFCLFFETFNSKSESWSSSSPSSRMTKRFLFRFERKLSSGFGFGWQTTISQTGFETESVLNRWRGCLGNPKVSAQLSTRLKSTSSSWTKKIVFLNLQNKITSKQNLKKDLFKD